MDILTLSFWLSLLLLVYTYVGYPLLVGALSRLRPRPVRRGEYLPRVSLVIVVRDGEAWVDAKLASCLAQDYPTERLEIIVVSDGSSDGTNARLRACRDPRVTSVELVQRVGKPQALNEAVAHASGELLVFTDIRQRLEPDAVRQLAANFADPDVGAASGELVLDSAKGEGFGEGIDLYWRYEKWLRRHEAGFHSSVGVTGALYALRRENFQPLPQNVLLDDVLVPMRVAMAGHRVVFDTAAVAHDIPSVSVDRERQRKIRTIAGNYQLVALEPALIDPRRNPIWWQYVSHKLLRLVVPLFLLVAFLSNLALLERGAFFIAAMGGQLLLYAVALAGMRLPRARKLRLVRIPATFLALNWFAVLGLLHFARHGNGRLQW